MFHLNTERRNRFDENLAFPRYFVKRKILHSHSVHTVLAISTKSPENKDFEILDVLIKIDFDIPLTL